ncbi:HAD-IIA family hydrolase [Cellulomonas bogoriensis]|uniref:Haloacid dehalogenase n=1 Tax=Cellulomonas bogoriensis 69B4 = DSM 16987 TaxID=1386082 RepID=A0A0A0BJ00_9CELL|nr:HAD hydrolase-like protein [Cellulomonas bogoriensis]KGM08488.1 haloacid dehalogenase [Cellulomonas bogoriensis 69B4 = DSM 16987]
MTTPQTVLLDLEGTLYTRDGVIDGAAEAVRRLRADGHVLRFLTNTDSQGTADLHAALVARGLEVPAQELFTPVVAASVALADDPGARVLVLGTAAVTAELAARLTVVGPGEEPTHVVVGDVRHSLTYDLLDGAFAALHGGARLVALQKGRFFLSGGVAHLDTGAVVAALEHAAAVEALVVGKPSTDFVRLALRSAPGSMDPGRTWVVGDDASTDVAMGLAFGARTVQVRTGKFALQSGDPSLPRAGAVVDSVADLPELMRSEAP